MKHLKMYEDFVNELNVGFKVNNEIALKKKKMSLECAKLIMWWGVTGYMYYKSLKKGSDIITPTADKMLTVLYNSLLDETYSDYLNGRKKAFSLEENPVFAEERVGEHLTKDYVDKVFSENLSVVKRPFKIAKNYDKGVKKLGTDEGWYSFSTNLNAYMGAFGDDYIEYELPVGFKYLDTSGLAETGEILIWGPDLKNAKFVTDVFTPRKKTN